MKPVYKKLFILTASVGAIFISSHYVSLSIKQDPIENTGPGTVKIVKIFIASNQPKNKDNV